MAQAKKKPAAKPAPVTNDKVYEAILESERNTRREVDNSRAELNREIDKLAAQLLRHEARTDTRFDNQDNKMDSHHKWVISLMVLILLAVLGPYLASLV